ncbi:mucin-2 isoform X1 [Toxorhynchites rutilus septentrionalis]|uniref:mucin-2 isoform X1 n=1 Tax=Toxorhynchites rutilus septentrionalis TaxID=329112 RepID=UPI002478EA48|nr:mucin-2 isoform X1 [Toxorhynchites rutilus septentrionalis]
MFPLQRGAATWLLLLATALSLCASSSNGGVSAASEANQRVVCYYTNWSVYRPGTAKFNPQNINPYLCTHLIYSFGGFTKENALKPYDKYQDIEQGGFAKFTGLKTYNKNLKTMLAIGGWNEGSSRFSPMVGDAERRSQFVKNAIKFLRQNHFDGLDLDWEYPAFRDGSKPKDRENYAQLVQELREEFDRESSKTGRPRLLLTMAVPAGIEYIEKGYDVVKLNKYLDWFNLLTYDYHSAYEPAVNHHSPLFSLEEPSEYNFDTELNIDYSIKFYLNAGAEREKLVLGIPTYGRSYTLYNPDATEIGSPADGPGEQGDATREKGYLAYYEICTAVKEDPEWTVVQPNPKAMGPYAFKGNQWVGYDDEAIARKKAKYVAENGLGGIMFWSIDNDDFRGTCHGKPYPIIEAAKETLLASTDVGVNDIAAPSRPRKPSRSRSRQGSSSTSRNRLNNDNNNEVKSSFKNTPSRKNVRPTARSTTTTTTSTTTHSSLYIGGRTTTPQPPTTPDPGADFKCTDEGFFQHPRDCKKYFWCLDAPSLGLVAHQFTCPSGLVFNKLADSCDYARNVACTTPTTTTTTSTTTTSTTSTTTSTTTPAPRARVTAATSRNTFYNRAFTTTSTTEPPIESDYSEEEVVEENQAEEDPMVIKELIALIKRVGGIEELERQLQAQEDGTVVLKGASTDQVSTTASTISKKLYERVLSRAGNGLQKFRPALTFTQTDKTGTTENKYSSVVRNSNSNSRVAPQNEGIEQLPEFEGVFKERPKYVTLHRSKPTRASVEEEEADERLDDVDELEEEENQPSTFATRRPTSSPKYVSIRRQRPTTTTVVDSEEDEEEASVAAPVQYSSLSRNRQRQTTTEEPIVEEVERVPSRYNTIERRRAPVQYNRLQEGDKDDVGTDSSLLVPSTDFQSIYTTSSTTDAPEQFITYNTRQYASVERSSTTEAPLTGPGATDLPQTTPIPTTTTTATGHIVQYLNTDFQTELPERETPSDTISDLDLSKTETVDSDALTTDDAMNVDFSKNEQNYEVTTILNLGESITGSSVSELEAKTYRSSVGSSGDSVNPSVQESAEDELLLTTAQAPTTTIVSEVQTTSTASPSTTTTVSTTSEKLTSTNDEQSNSIFKFPPRTRKTTTTTTTTASPLEFVTNKHESDSQLTPTQAAPRPFGGAVRRTRPTRRPLGSATTTTTAPEESTTLRSVKVSFAKGQRYDLSARRRIGVAGPSPAVNPSVDVEVGNAGGSHSDEPSTRPSTRPRGYRGRVRFGSSTELSSITSSEATTTGASEQSRRPSLDSFARNRFSLNRAASSRTTTTEATTTTTTDRIATTTELPVEQFSARASLRRVNFNLYSGRSTTEGGTTTTEEPEIETEPPVTDTKVKSHTGVNEELFKTQERILLTLGTALEYGFSNRNELNARRKGSVNEAPITNIVKEQPITQGHSEDTINTRLAEDVNEMATEHDFGTSSERSLSLYESTVGDLERSTEITTINSLNEAVVETTTPGQRKFFGALRNRATASVSTTESNDTTLKVVVSEVNTNKTFIPGRLRPTRPSRLRSTTSSSSESLNEASTLRSKFSSRQPTVAPNANAISSEETPKPFRRPSPFARRQRPTLSTSSPVSSVSEITSSEITEKTPGISTTVVRRRPGRRRTTPVPASSSEKSVEEVLHRERPSPFSKRQRPLVGRPSSTSTSTEFQTTAARAATTTTVEPITAEPTYADSAVGNSDFTTVISDVSNEIESSFILNNVLDSENLLRRMLSESQEAFTTDDATEMPSTIVTSEQATEETNRVTPTRKLTTPARRLLSEISDNQQIESEVIPSRSPARTFGGARKKFGASTTTTTTESPEVSTVKKFVPSRKNRPSFSVAKARSSTTTEESTAQEQETPSSSTARSFAPSRRRTPLNVGALRTTTPSVAANVDNSDSFPSRAPTPARKRPAFAANRPSRPQSFEDSFDKGSSNTAVKPSTERKVNRTSVLLPRRPNLFARTTTTTTEGYTDFETDLKTTLEDETSAERYGTSTRGYTDIRRPSSSEERGDGVTGRFSGEVEDDENEIQRQGKRLFGGLGSENNNVDDEDHGGRSKERVSGEVGTSQRRPGPRVVGSGSRRGSPGSNTRFIFKNNQPLEGPTTTARVITTRSRRPFGNVGGYKPSNVTTAGVTSGGGAVGGASTARPRFTLTTRGRSVFGRQRSTTSSPAAGIAEDKATAQRTSEVQQATPGSRRYQPRKPSRKSNLTSISTPVGSGRTRPNLSTLFNRNPVVLLTTTEPTTSDLIQPETTLPSVDPQTTATVLPVEQQSPPQPTTTPKTLDIENEIENTTSYEDTINTVRTTTEYYTASDETLYTTLNTADTIYTINDNIDIDDVNILQERSRTSTTTVRPTTLYHVFSIDKESESMPSSTEIYRTEEQEIELPAANKTDKLVEIHRVVEIYTKNTSNPDEIPVMQKLGEINRKIIIRLVEPKNKTDAEDNDKKNRMLLFADNVFNVETSTIPLQGLFDPDKDGNTGRAQEFHTTDVNLEEEVTTMVPRVEIEHIASSDFANTERTQEELVTITPQITETERYTQVTTSTAKPDTERTLDFEDSTVNEDEERVFDYYTEELPTTVSVQNSPPTTTTATTTEAPTTTTPTEAPISSTTQFVHKYTLPAEFFFQEPSDEPATTTVAPSTTSTTTPTTTTPTTTTELETTTTTTTTTTTPEPTTTTIQETTTTPERVRPLFVPTAGTKKKYTKRPKTTVYRPQLDFVYTNENSGEDEPAVVTEHATEPLPSTSTPRIQSTSRRYVPSGTLRANQGEGPSHRKSKDIQVVPLPKAAPRAISAKPTTTPIPIPITTTTTPEETTTTTEKTTPTTTTTTTTTTTEAPITKVDFNIKYVVPMITQDFNAAELKIESKNDKYSVPLSSLYHPDFITKEISGEQRQERQYSPVYRPELDNDELTRALTSDPDPVALEAASLDREILGDRSLVDSGSEERPDFVVPRTMKAYFFRRSGEVS